ncbi:hypothetical protein ZWY2020_009751 [Hordeum vulgare]|nr:hypothetical protein ZWY2020_009751 [Hordeum vulgare]
MGGHRHGAAGGRKATVVALPDGGRARTGPASGTAGRKTPSPVRRQSPFPTTQTPRPLPRCANPTTPAFRPRRSFEELGPAIPIAAVKPSPPPVPARIVVVLSARCPSTPAVSASSPCQALYLGFAALWVISAAAATKASFLVLQALGAVLLCGQFLLYVVPEG